MKKTHLLGLLVLVLLVGGTFACDSSNPVAPTGTTLTITANPTLIALDGGQSTITVTGFRPDGNPLFPGTQIRFTTSLGTISPGLAEVGNSGQATAVLTSNGQMGPAMVSASTTAGDVMAETSVQIGDDDTSRHVLTITAAPTELDLNSPGEIIVDVRNADGSAFGANGDVTLTTDLGCFGTGSDNCPKETVAVTNTASRASAPFFSLDEAGTATVRAFFLSAMAEAMLTIENQQPQLLVTANPSIIGTRGRSEIRILARDENGIPLGAEQRIRLVADLGSVVQHGGSAEISSVNTDADGEAVADFVAGDRAGMGMVTATLGTSEPATVAINIRAAAGEVRIDADPRSIQRLDGGVEIQLTAVVLDVQGETLGGVLVTFEPDHGTFETGTGGSVVTNAQGRASDTLTVTATDVDSVPENGSFTITVRATSEGITVTNSIEIEVQGSPS